MRTIPLRTLLTISMVVYGILSLFYIFSTVLGWPIYVAGISFPRLVSLILALFYGYLTYASFVCRANQFS